MSRPALVLLGAIMQPGAKTARCILIFDLLHVYLRRSAPAAVTQGRPASPPESPAARSLRLSRRSPPSTSAADARRAEAEALRTELAAARQAAADASMAAQKAATRRSILEGEVKFLRHPASFHVHTDVCCPGDSEMSVWKLHHTTAVNKLKISEAALALQALSKGNRVGKNYHINMSMKSYLSLQRR